MLFLATCLMVVRWMVLDRGHARVQEIMRRHASPASVSGPSLEVADAAGGVPAVTTPEHGSGKGIPLQDLPLIGKLFSDDLAAQAEVAAMLAELGRISSPTRGAADIDGVMSFRRILGYLGIAVPEEMTEAQAAAEFLRHAEAAIGTLAKLRVAADKAPWDWGQWQIDRPGSEQTALMVALQSGAWLARGLIQAHWLAGDGDAAWTSWEAMQLFADRAADASMLDGTLAQGRIQYTAARTVGVGIAQARWSDEQLALISQSLAAYDALDSLRRGLEGDKLALHELSQRPYAVKASMDQISQGRPLSWSAAGNWLAVTLTTDQQIRDNLALAVADIDYGLARFDYQQRRYLPPNAGELPPTQELLESGSVLDQYFSMTAKSYGGKGTHPWGTIHSQTTIDQAGLAAALELQRRTTGQYPDMLDAIGRLFSNGIPHDVATGQPYFYERTPDAAYRIWGTGVDQTNHGGDPKKDILFTPPKFRAQ
jgi:hypothetical protein